MAKVLEIVFKRWQPCFEALSDRSAGNQPSELRCVLKRLRDISENEEITLLADGIKQTISSEPDGATFLQRGVDARLDELVEKLLIIKNLGARLAEKYGGK